MILPFSFILFFDKKESSAVETLRSGFPCTMCKSIKENFTNNNISFNQIDQFRAKFIGQHSRLNTTARGFAKIIANDWLEYIYYTSSDKACSFVCENMFRDPRNEKNNKENTNLQSEEKSIDNNDQNHSLDSTYFRRKYKKHFSKNGIRPQINSWLPESYTPKALSRRHPKMDCDECLIYMDLLLQIGPEAVTRTDDKGMLYSACMSIELLKGRCSMFTLESSSKFIHFLAENVQPFEICLLTRKC